MVESLVTIGNDEKDKDSRAKTCRSPTRLVGRGVHFCSELIGFLLTRRAAKVVEGVERGLVRLPVKAVGRVRASFPRARPLLLAG
jgi:hypothetical protein